jgi:hypothetical protein
MGAASDMNLAEARSTNCGNGTAIAPSESSGSGTHAKIAIARRFRRDNATASAVTVVVMLMGVPKVLIRPQKTLLAYDRDNPNQGGPPTGGTRSLDQVNAARTAS